MRSWHDQFVKAILRALLRPIAHVETEHEIVGHKQSADVWVSLAQEIEAPPELGMLGRMVAMGPCLLEPFSRTPRPADVRSCVGKQYSLHHGQVREARGAKQPVPSFPRLWIVSPGLPRTVIKQAPCQAMDSWPAGFWEASPWQALHIVSVNALPRTPETLLLRMLGKETLGPAIHDLGDMPEGAGLKALLVPVLVAFRAEMNQDSQEEELMLALQEIDTIYAQWEERVRREASRADRQAVLVVLLRQRFGDLPGDVQARIEQADMADLQRWTERVIPAQSLADVFA